MVDLAYGSGPHVVALTSQGELFSWGHNGYGQLGQGASIITAQGMFPKRLDGDFAGVRVVSVACGGHHTVAVTAAGEVRTLPPIRSLCLSVCLSAVCLSLSVSLLIHTHTYTHVHCLLTKPIHMYTSSPTHILRALTQPDTQYSLPHNRKHSDQHGLLVNSICSTFDIHRDLVCQSVTSPLSFISHLFTCQSLPYFLFLSCHSLSLPICVSLSS